MVTGGLDVGPSLSNLRPVERVGFRGECFADGPTGVNRADLASGFPASITTAATWDQNLMYQRGLVMGAEFRQKGAKVMLGWLSKFCEASTRCHFSLENQSRLSSPC